ncbi:hypothetical protein BLNAU_8000 [Blattamonas nauphoetae]|uniref:Transmembrane protein n=1 Tax=Blattamonas nauphoetae TaxID=2049346 RepID=A0ABQ9XZM5_9EUKA|nr:hypothetical protein BLNAU_8000 [Blattamonas nauphoetae]
MSTHSSFLHLFCTAAADSRGATVSTAVLPVTRQHPSIHAVSEGDDVMCVAQNASDCGDSVSSREVGWVDVLSVASSLVFRVWLRMGFAKSEVTVSGQVRCRRREQRKATPKFVSRGGHRRRDVREGNRPHSTPCLFPSPIPFSLFFFLFHSSISPPSTHFHFLRPSFSSQRAFSDRLVLKSLSPLLPTSHIPHFRLSLSPFVDGVLFGLVTAATFMSGSVFFLSSTVQVNQLKQPIGASCSESIHFEGA